MCDGPQVQKTYRKTCPRGLLDSVYLEAERSHPPPPLSQSPVWLTSTGIRSPSIHLQTTLRRRHNGRDGVWNHQPHDCLLNRLFRRRSKETSKLRVTGLCEGNSPVTGNAVRGINRSSVVSPHKGVAQTVEFLVVWDAITLMWRYFRLYRMVKKGLPVEYHAHASHLLLQLRYGDTHQEPLLLTLINFIPSMDK